MSQEILDVEQLTEENKGLELTSANVDTVSEAEGLEIVSFFPSLFLREQTAQTAHFI